MKKLSTTLVLVLGLGASALSHANERLAVSSQGQLYMQLQQLQQEVATLRGMLEEQQHQLQQIEQTNLERYQALEQRNAPATEQTTFTAEPAKLPQPTNQRAEQQQTTAAETADPAKEQEFYDAAFSLIRKREFDTAQQAFSGFLRRYPNGQYAANAYYWLGEIHLVQEDFQAAGKAFATVIQNWPDHSKVADSMYKLADVERRMGQPERAKVILQQVTEQYPRSSAAKLAQQDLQRL
ncbi:MAG: tol-pal system protein YbgF [Gammaproteobacteria bacterium]|nr:tol-pal system protein YbgF [Gammaproteobacteria bacterium]